MLSFCGRKKQQGEKQMEKKKIYVVSTAHLDTTWLWTLKTTIERYLPETFNRNFSLFEKYPEHKFSFEGSYRYEMIEEYYPEAFNRIKEYVKKGNWAPTGSCYENGDVNIPSPEALTRNILYGQNYFLDKLGKRSNDIFLPDCFGFGAALPSVAAHCGLKGFSTAKLRWGSAYGTPFDIGKWCGNDGSFVYASISPGSYARSLSEIRTFKEIQDKLKTNIEKYSLPVTFAYHGTGDRGGSTAEPSVKNLFNEAAKNGSSDTEVIETSSTEFFEIIDSLPDEAKNKLPVYDGELLMTEHGTGSYTSRAVGKRFNRRNEQLADAAERSAVAAGWLNGYTYPAQTFEKAWKRVVAHHFHDDITGTSIMECYRRNWNDYIQSLNVFAGEYTAAERSIASSIDTSKCKGVPVTVSNPLQWERTETVTATINWDNKKPSAKVYNSKGKEVLSKVTAIGGGKLSISFSASVMPFGVSVFDIRPADKPCALKTDLTASNREFENKYIKAVLDENGDICSLIDKQANRELISKPVSLQLIDNLSSKYWPAWEVKYEDVMRPVREIPGKAEIKLVEDGPARIVYSVTKKAGGSHFTQLISLDSGSKFIRIFNEVDWRSSTTLLKAAFTLNGKNEIADYDIGAGCIGRKTNTKKIYEVPAQNFADISDESGEFGLSVFSDSRTGWDKPDESTIRLTCIHTPVSSFRWECSQHLMDLGLNRFSFGLYPHGKTNLASSAEYAAAFNQPMAVFATDKHEGIIKENFSFGSVSNNAVAVKAIKKAEKSDKIIIRFNETVGAEHTAVKLTLGSGISEAQEVNGIEEQPKKAEVKNGELIFDIGANEFKTFALTLNPFENVKNADTIPLELPLDRIIITSNDNRDSSTVAGRFSIPAEIIPEEIICGGAKFNINKTDSSAMACSGQEIRLPANANKVIILAAAISEARLTYKCGDETVIKTIPSSRERIGAWDMVGLKETGFIKKDSLAFTATHTHTPAKDLVAEQFYVFRYEFNIPSGAKSFSLNGKEIYVLAASAIKGGIDFENANELYDSLEKRPFDYYITDYQRKYATPLKIEKLTYKFISPEYTRFIYSKKRGRAIQLTDFFCDKRNDLNGRK